MGVVGLLGINDHRGAPPVYIRLSGGPHDHIARPWTLAQAAHFAPAGFGPCARAYVACIAFGIGVISKLMPTNLLEPGALMGPLGGPKGPKNAPMGARGRPLGLGPYVGPIGPYVGTPYEVVSNR